MKKILIELYTLKTGRIPSDTQTDTETEIETRVCNEKLHEVRSDIKMETASWQITSPVTAN